MSSILNKALLLFIAKYNIPWIWAWRFHISTNFICSPSLNRTYWVKSWKKFDFKYVIDQVQMALEEYKQDQKAKTAEISSHVKDKYELLLSIIK